MVKHNKKSYKKHKKPFKAISKKPNKKNVGPPHKKTNFKFIQRAKETEDYQRRQRAIEEKYREEANNFILHQELSNMPEAFVEEELEEENPFEQLMKQLPSETNVKEEEQTDDDEEEEEQGEEEAEEEEDAESLEGDEEDELMEAVDEEEGIHSAMDDDKGSSEATDVEQSEDESEAFKEDDDDNDNENTDTDEKSAAANNKNDPFAKHLDFEASSEHIENLTAPMPKTKSIKLEWSALGKLNLEVPLQNVSKESNATHNLESLVPGILKTKELQRLYFKKNLIENVKLPLTQLQSELLAVIADYHDIYYPQRTYENAEEVRYVYTMHLLNHMLKTRSRILNNNAKLAATAKTKKLNKNDLVVADSLRDQGLVRPKVLLILPFRESALRTVNMLIELLFGKENKTKNSIINYERFASEYGGDTLYFPKTNPKPVDYEQTFAGNTDDNFRIGLSLTKKSIKLYTEFYASDIIIASPLALRLVIAGQSDKNERDYDFLNSIELLIIDQAELLFAQNWENLLHIMEHMHLQPQSLRDTNFQRVREWYLNGLAKFYRQTLLFSSHELPEFRALFSSKCCNYNGKLRVQNPILIGNMRNVISNIPQTFQRINVTSLETMFDQRFNYFVQKVLPRFKNPSFAHCMIYVPSYFDYVRLRNYFRKETINFVQICEYTEKGKIAKARDMFFHSAAHFMLYSERGHFFRRTRVKGIRHLIMYQPPTWPNFYSEMINLMHESNQNARDGLSDSMSITVLYTKYDMLQLCNAIGTENAAKIINSNKSMHAFSSQ